MKRLHLILAALGITLIGGIWFASRGIGQTPTPPASTSLADLISANGSVEGATPEVALRPEIVGTIRRIPFRENQKVKKGDLLVELDNDVQKHQVAIAQAEWKLAEAQLERVRNGEQAEKRQALAAQEAAKKAFFEQTQKTWERYKELVTRSTISKEEFDTAFHQLKRAEQEWLAAKAEVALVEAPTRQDEVDAALARVEAAKARWKLAEAELAKTRILAPSDGCVLQVLAEPGDQATPTSKAVILFADVSKLRVRAFVEELDAPRVRPGQVAQVTVDGLPGKTFAGKVHSVLSRMGKRAPQSDASNEYHDMYYREVLIDLDATDGLLVNLRTIVRIQGQDRRN